jgi:diacylglycerol O-acyltransferase / wax synthase
MPFNLANPVWVDSELKINDHVLEVRLPKNSSVAALEAKVGELHTQLLDRKRPLWRFFVLEGLAPAANGAKRVGVYSQLHHAAADGQAAVAIANAILDLQPGAQRAAAKTSDRPKTFKIGMAEMLRGALASEVEQVTKLVKALPAAAGAVKHVASQSRAVRSLTGAKDNGVSNVKLAPRTAINTSVTNGRAFASVDVPMAELKSLGRAHEATINDMVLMLCSSALRRYFSKRHHLPKTSLIAAVPISLREKGNTSSDNQASMSLVSLGTHIADTAARLAHIKAATSAMKSTMGGIKNVLPTDFPSIGMPWLMEAATSLYGRARVADRIPQLANLVISNVPGPPVPLYLAGAKVLSIFPTSIIVHGMGLNITVQSYDQTLGFGLMADLQAMPDVSELAQAISVAFDDLRALTVPGEEAPMSTSEKVVRAANSTRRKLTDAVGKAVGNAVKGAVQGAVQGAASELGAAVRKRAGKMVTPSRRD